MKRGEREREKGEGGRERERREGGVPTLITNDETESGSSRAVEERTSFSKKQNRDILGK